MAIRSQETRPSGDAGGRGFGFVERSGGGEYFVGANGSGLLSSDSCLGGATSSYILENGMGEFRVLKGAGMGIRWGLSGAG